MSIRSSIDPKEYNKNSPTLDTVVTGESCFYYISLLKTFHDLRKSMTNDEYIIFVYAAVWRYTEFLFNTRPDAYTNSMALPLDIAYVWHAHMLNPFQYYEDIAKQPSRECSIGIHFDFPLKAMVIWILMIARNGHMLRLFMG
ncbi:hypothetical protein BX666DRAFT_663861 [Dichotomocladium elegans]|nr:hypothetical protein BX666DRAFT_663861 [Dichotomocladium elegans]